jgi:hypothetical protein
MVRQERCIDSSYKPNTAGSHDYRRAVLHLTITTLLYPKHLCLVSCNYFHPLQLCFSRACHTDLKEGACTPVSVCLKCPWTLNERVKVSGAQRTRWSMLCLALLTSLLTLVTFFHLPEGVFAAFTIITGITLAATGSYLQTSVIAVASLFGPTVIQSMLSGQAVVAVILSSVQLISAATSLHTSELGPAPGVAETVSARLFFGISTTFLFACGAANAWMTRLPSYRAVVPIDRPWIQRRISVSESLGSPILSSHPASTPDSRAIWDNIISVARRNIIYELAVAYVFIITLVSQRARLLECPV